MATSSPIARSAWIDNLRTAVIVLVVNMHACVTYSHVGDWLCPCLIGVSSVAKN